MGTAASCATQGLQILIVEDEALLALVLQDMLTDLGCILVGAADSVEQALAEIRRIPAIDAAILDVHLGGELVFPVADELVTRHVPFVFSTGFGPKDLAERYPDSGFLAKPYPPEALAAVLAHLGSGTSRSD